MWHDWKKKFWKNYIFWTEEVLIENVFPFFSISGPTGSGKPDASIQSESLDQEEPNDTSSSAIGPANPSILP